MPARMFRGSFQRFYMYGRLAAKFASVSLQETKVTAKALNKRNETLMPRYGEAMEANLKANQSLSGGAKF
jgi:hypothetical protein